MAGSTLLLNTASEVEHVSSIGAMRELVREARAGLRRIAFVPTMGYLHEGHLALVDAARERADMVVLSVFVNPLQFAPTEDLSRYPRDPEGDARKALERGADVFFAPDASEMYPAPVRVQVVPFALADHWEGAARPGHFAGVLTVVLKLLAIVQPDVTLLGQKDAQQAVLVRAMCEDLNLGTEVHVVPTVRDPDGLALSSRNAYLSADDRARALALPRALDSMVDAFVSGERDANRLITYGRAVIEREPGIVLEYLGMAEPSTLDPLARAATDGDFVLVAARVGATRLIDNVILRAP